MNSTAKDPRLESSTLDSVGLPCLKNWSRDSERRLFLLRRYGAFPLRVEIRGDGRAYAVEAAQFLEEQGASLLVIACNTATALALDRITPRPTFLSSAWWNREPNGSSASKNRRVVVVGTEATVAVTPTEGLERRGS